MPDTPVSAEYRRIVLALEHLAANPRRYGGASVIARWGLGDDTVTCELNDGSEGGLADA